MRFRSLIGALLLVALGSGSALRADEPVLEFLAGLRAREYYDTALQYLDTLEQRSDLAPEVRQALPYERAVTLSADARDQRNAETQTKQFEAAKKLLTQFLASSPKHSKAADANNELGLMHMTRGQSMAQQAKRLAAPAERAAMQVQARGEFEKARSPFEAAERLFKTRLDEFPKQIDRVTQKEQFAAREHAMLQYITAQFNLGQCTFEEAHSYDPSSLEAKSLLTRAAGEFDKIYLAYRTTQAGLTALLYEGRCFQEQGELGKALGIFDQILKLQEETGALRPLQDQARYHRLVAMSDDKRPDLKGVKAEAEEWLNASKPASKRSPTGLGIQWELVQALEKLAKDKETTAVEKDLYLKQALATSQFINQHASEFKGPAGLAIGRLTTALKIKKAGTPRDFEAAYASAMLLVDEMDKRSKDLATAKPDEQATQEKALELHIRDTARTLRLALSLYSPKDSLADLNSARLLLANLYYKMKDHSYDAALLAEHIARRYKSIDEKAAQDAAVLSMAAYLQGYYAAPADQQAADISQLLAMGEYITATWPGSDRTNEVLMQLGQLYSQIQQPMKAAEFYNRIPETSATYLDAQLDAGLAYWRAYLSLGILPEKERPSKTDLEAMMKKSEQILTTALEKAEKKLAKGQPTADNINSAKLSLVQILNSIGNHKKALELLTVGDRSLTKEVAADNAQARPERGPKSRMFASLTYREVLRAYVGTQDVEQARAALKQLEALETGGAQGLNSLLRELGQQLQSEVKQLQQANNPRVTEVTASFEKFLADLLQRKEGQDYTMLYWIGETYTALGDGLKGGGGDAAKANELFGKAAEANKAILTLAAADPKAVPATYLPTIRLRLVASLRRQQAFEPAVEEIKKILKENQQNFPAQIEAAQIYTDWGLRDGAKDATKWLVAVKGDRPAGIWGWEAINNRLSATLKTKNTPEYKKAFLDARYNVVLGKFNFALLQAKPETKEKLLQQARMDVKTTGLLSTLDKNDSDRKRYDELFRNIQTQLNTATGSNATIVGLDVALNTGSSAENADPEEAENPDAATGLADKKDKKAAASKDSDGSAKKDGAKESAKKAEHKGGTSWVMIALLAVVGVGACGYIGYMVWNSAKKTRRPTRRRASAKDTEKEDEEPVAKKTTTRKRRPLPASPPEETE